MRVGMIAPISHPFPPTGYGPWERVCSDLTEGLVELGHEVVVFAPHGSQTSGQLHPTVERPLSEAEKKVDPRLEETEHIAEAVSESIRRRLDVVHSHLHVHALGYGPLMPMPLVTTLHGSAWVEAHHRLLRRFRDLPFVSLSESERRFLPELNYVATVGNGIRLADFPAGPGGDDLVFVGRLAPEKGPDLAIAAARAAGRGLVLAGVVEDRYRDFFAAEVEPHLGESIAYAGPLPRPDVVRLMGESAGLLMPLRWEEPFGLVVVEAMAVGTPVVAWRRGAMPELVTDDLTGYLVDDVLGAADALGRLPELDRDQVRSHAHHRFGHRTMAEGYVDAYQRAVRSGHDERGAGKAGL